MLTAEFAPRPLQTEEEWAARNAILARSWPTW